jgi:hypothetical protein
MEEAVEIAKLRLFLALVASAQTVDQLEPLPNIDFNILAGNSLIGLMQVDAKEFDNRYGQGHLFTGSYYRQALDEKNRLIDTYRHTATYADDLRRLRDNIDTKKREAGEALNEILLEDFGKLGIKFEEATWDDAKKKEGKPKKRPLKIEDIQALRPFHWGYEFDQIVNERGGFDAIITNPPWEAFKPQAKEFFAEYSGLVTKNKMTIKEFEKEQTRLMKDPEIRAAWLEYRSRFPHVNLYVRNAAQYSNQVSVVDGRKQVTDINLFKLFIEQCFNLLRNGGECGIVVPSGIYTDIGAKQLRELLFADTEITGLFGFENRKAIFENVDSRFKFVVLTFRRGENSPSFPVAFMRHDVEELSRFPREGALKLPIDLVRRLAPDSLSLMEFRSKAEMRSAEKMTRFPRLKDEIAGSWNLLLEREFHMTDDSDLYRAKSGAGCLPLYEGKMIHQFDHRWGEPKYWLNEKEASRRLLAARRREVAQAAKAGGMTWDGEAEPRLAYTSYRLAFRDVARNTDERTMIVTVLPPNVFCPHTMSLEKVYEVRIVGDGIEPNFQGLTDKVRLFLCGIMNSFVIDAWLRRSVTAHLSFFFVYAVPIPRLTDADSVFNSIVDRAAKTICTTREFDDLAREVGLGSHKNGVTDPTERAKLRAELDGMIAHLYGLTEEEFTHILSTFPLVEQSVKDAALEAYQELAPKTGDQEVASLIARGESVDLEFKASAKWDMRQDKPNKEMEAVIVKTVASFLNAAAGGTLLIGVDDEGNVLGLQHDYKTLGRKQGRDGFENWLTTLLLDAYGKDTSPLIRITFHEVQSKEVCRVIAHPSGKPVFVRDDKAEHLYIRTGNSTRLLSTREAIEYCKVRWP